ncbi:DDE-type integrase/transposase/recombinase [Chelativorans alearense]|uniref:DDE-type integrase/transposase/recombinase n=1 Tax=Chelativorans alearense TaxID=2681495 RepID=UPI001969FADA|nr:DDE-type integrase/transposase/recombinase [Chelativorans alearense]
MKVWLTAQEFADLAAAGALSDLPATKAGMLKLIRREGWDDHRGLARPRAGRKGGGGMEYHIDNISLSSRIALAARHFHVEAEDLRPAVTEADGLTGRARETRDARLVLLRLADRFRRDQALSVAAADSLFSDLFNTASIELPAWVTARVKNVSARSLARWRSRRNEDPERLGHDHGEARRGTGQLDRALDGRVKAFILAAIAKKPFLSAKHVRAMVADTFGGEMAVPPLRTFQATLKAWREAYRNELQYLTDPDGYRSKTEYALVNAARAERLNECWQIDASPADVMLMEGRHSIYLAIDVHSRRTKVLATKTPRAAGVGMLTRKCLIAWGVPERIKIDNGSDFAAHATQRLLAALAIEVDFSHPYSPKEKGMVERAIGTFQRDLSGLPGFIGHSVADRKRIEGRKSFAQRMGADERELFEVEMSLAEFQAWCDDWCDKIYAHTPHAGIARRTPFDVAAAYPGQVRRVENVAALDILLAPVAGRNGIRTVTKTGVRIDSAHYLPDAVMPGTMVFCRMDPADLGRALLFEPDGETFLGEAVCPELAGLDPVETISRVKAAQKAHVDGRIKDIRREMRKIGPRAVADAMRNQADRRAGTLVAFPGRSEGHDTPALSAAADAARPTAPGELGERAAQVHRELQAEALPAAPEAEASAPVVARLPETREQRFRRALKLEDRRAMGERLADEELLWLGGYQAGSEYRAMKAMLEEFGREAMRL